MSEQVEQLKATIAELHDELANIDSLDDETRALLFDAKDEMEAALNPDLPDELEPQSLTDRFHQAIQEFDESHPTLSRVLGKLIDALGQMGI